MTGIEMPEFNAQRRERRVAIDVMSRSPSASTAFLDKPTLQGVGSVAIVARPKEGADRKRPSDRFHLHEGEP